MNRQALIAGTIVLAVWIAMKYVQGQADIEVVLNYTSVDDIPAVAETNIPTYSILHFPTFSYYRRPRRRQSPHQ